MNTSSEALVRPGAGVEVEQIRLAPIKADLQNGSYIINEQSQQAVDLALSDPTMPLEDIRDALNQPDNKGFRNAYTSIILDQIWPDYQRLAAEGQPQQIQFKDGKSSLAPYDLDLDQQAAKVMADLIAGSNQDIPTHLVCEVFQNENVPVISGDVKKDLEYFRAFQAQTELLTTKTDSFFPTVPKEMGAPSRFIASGLLVLRSHVFGTPNLMDEVATQQNLTLNPRQHRNGFGATMLKSTVHYYLPSGPLTISINSQLVNPKTGRLRPEQWTSNGDVENFVVYPRPAIVEAANQEAQQHGLPPQTNCPVFHSRVPANAGSTELLPAPRSLVAGASGQLDTWYYPRRQAEHDRRSGTFFVQRPDWAVSASHALDPSFPNGLFVPSSHTAPAIETAASTPSLPLTEAEQGILSALGAERTVESFGRFMQLAQEVFSGENLNSVAPSPDQTQLQYFFRRLMVDADAAFDAQRSAFATPEADGKAFLSALYNIPIARLSQNGIVTAGEALTVFNKAVGDPAVYPPHAQAAIRQSFQQFLQVGVMGMSRQESTDLSARRTQQVKETTNGLYAGILFDLAFASHSDQPGYSLARDRYVATKLAYQYNDEILDIMKDAAEGSSNILTALAAEHGELESINAAAERLFQALPEGLDLENPTAIHRYCELLEEVAPKAYKLLVARQQELLRQANLPEPMAAMIALPIRAKQ